MLELTKALELILEAAPLQSTETVPLTAALNRILAQDVKADSPLPPFNKSAMDGYACRQADLDQELSVIATIAAGEVSVINIKQGKCAKIMTGAMVPAGADCVIMVEETRETASSCIRFTGKTGKTNICYQGEDVQKGELLLPRGTRIQPQHIAVLATCGCTYPLVARQPRVGIIATGNELVEPGIQPGPGKIRNSNSYALAAQLIAIGITPTYYGIALDEPGILDAKIKEAQAANDVLLISGGVSMGDYDLVPGILKQNGYTLLFETVQIQPGKPTVFGKTTGSTCFGLPGNPVSTFVIFEIFVKPFLYQCMGHRYEPVITRAILETTVTRKKTGRLSFYPVRFTTPGNAAPLTYHGSAHITALCTARGLISLPPGISELQAGTAVDVRQI